MQTIAALSCESCGLAKTLRAQQIRGPKYRLICYDCNRFFDLKNLARKSLLAHTQVHKFRILNPSHLNKLEAAKAFSLPPGLIERLVRDGTIPDYRHKGRWQIPVTSLLSLGFCVIPVGAPGSIFLKKGASGSLKTIHKLRLN